MIRDERWRDHEALDPLPRSMPLQHESGRSGFITEAQFCVRMRLAQLREELVHAVQVAAEAAVKAHFCSGFCDSDGNGLGMDIQPDMNYRSAHGVSELWFY